MMNDRLGSIRHTPMTISTIEKGSFKVVGPQENLKDSLADMAIP